MDWTLQVMGIVYSHDIDISNPGALLDIATRAHEVADTLNSIEYERVISVEHRLRFVVKQAAHLKKVHRRRVFLDPFCLLLIDEFFFLGQWAVLERVDKISLQCEAIDVQADFRRETLEGGRTRV